MLFSFVPITPEGEFFDRQAASYCASRGGMRPFHEVTARTIEAGLGGSVLSVGGLWNSAEPSGRGYRLTVLDVSAEMLKRSAREGIELIQGDVRTTSFADASFDHVVLPLVLHHVAGLNALTARRNVREILGRLFPILRPGGRVWISEFCVPRAVYAVEVPLAPAIRWGLSLARIPLVVMHTARFYESALVEAGFDEVRAGPARRCAFEVDSACHRPALAGDSPMALPGAPHPDHGAALDGLASPRRNDRDTRLRHEQRPSNPRALRPPAGRPRGSGRSTRRGCLARATGPGLGNRDPCRPGP
jgi:SAM-dependent methyltransferase